MRIIYFGILNNVPLEYWWFTYIYYYIKLEKQVGLYYWDWYNKLIEIMVDSKI